MKHLEQVGLSYVRHLELCSKEALKHVDCALYAVLHGISPDWKWAKMNGDAFEKVLREMGNVEWK